ncbi:hypothetical protein H0H93_012463 [Arthromyces matolae]|nr:hypothetical protein H0H93_012463 [Arthromyces matolae]
MPSDTPASALVRLHFSTDVPGFIWTLPRWKETTGITHGIFPAEGEPVPRGLKREELPIVLSFFETYHAIGSETERTAFVLGLKGSPYHPGRPIWTSFVNKQTPRWNLHYHLSNQLYEQGAHPSQVLINRSVNVFDTAVDLKDKWPPSSQYVPIVVDSIGRELLGDEAFTDGGHLLPQKFREAFMRLLQRSWDLIRRNTIYARTHSDTIRKNAVDAWKDVVDNDKKPTKTTISQAIKAVAKWRNAASATNYDQGIQDAITITGLVPAVASEKDVEDIVNLFYDCFEADVDDDSDVRPEDNLIPASQAAMNDHLSKGGDFGVEMELTMGPKSLARELGFVSHHLPAGFIPVRHVAGLNLWDNPKAFTSREHLIQSSLHWHQLAGIHATIRHTFSEQPDDHVNHGILIGDEVGLGKTAQTIATIACLNQAIDAQLAKQALPPAIAKRPYLVTNKKLPSRPHLIVAPGTLLAQWSNEIKTLYKPNEVDIFVLDSNVSQAKFWSETGPFNSSTQPMHKRIVIASHALIFKEFAKHHKPPVKAKKDSRPWDQWDRKTETPLETTIFGQSFFTITVDEAHLMRNPGAQHSAILKLLWKARLRLILTATPLHTAPKDTAAMLRLGGVGYFVTEDSHQDEKSDASELRRAKKLDDDGEAVLECQLSVIERLRDYAYGNFIRRSTQSLDYKGRNLILLPGVVTIIGLLKLMEREEAGLMSKYEAVSASVVVEAFRIMTKQFYQEYRALINYLKLNPDGPYPTINTMADWEYHKGTKIDVLARVLAHYLSADDVPDVQFVQGLPVFPSRTATTPITRKRRIIVYAVFSSMAPFMQSVLKVFNIESLAINGRIAVPKRDGIIKQFYDDDHPARVILLSSVGSAGLNLAIADVVIFFDQPWSAQDERQIIGRAHRQPQKKVVKTIYLLAENTAEILIHNLAKGKANMFEFFINPEMAAETFSNLLGIHNDDGTQIKGDPVDGDDDDQDIKSSKKKKKKTTTTTTKKKKAKSRRVLEEEEEAIEEAIVEPASAPAPSAEVDDVDDIVEVEGKATDDLFVEEGEQTDAPALSEKMDADSDGVSLMSIGVPDTLATDSDGISLRSTGADSSFDNYPTFADDDSDEDVVAGSLVPHEVSQPDLFASYVTVEDDAPDSPRRPSPPREPSPPTKRLKLPPPTVNSTTIRRSPKPEKKPRTYSRMVATPAPRKSTQDPPDGSTTLQRTAAAPETPSISSNPFVRRSVPSSTSSAQISTPLSRNSNDTPSSLSTSSSHRPGSYNPFARDSRAPVPINQLFMLSKSALAPSKPQTDASKPTKKGKGKERDPN